VPRLLDINNLTVEFATAQGMVTAVRDVSFHIDAGEVLGLVGESGSVGVMYAGQVVEMGTAREVFRHPVHPYTRGLLHSVPTLRSDRSKPLPAVEGTVPAISALPPGCAFEPRCPSRIASCVAELPPLVEVTSGHFARCPVVAQEVR
jgi:oligopeptide/dipeptide ABC transporter ATP-binding protein